ncbi:MAG: sigma 54-interacting transcriptional regulator, partial [Bacteroidota bacterium]
MDQVHLFEEVSAWCVERFPYDFFWIAENGDIVFANESVCKTLGYSKIELESLKIFDVNPKTTKETWAGHWERVQTKKVDHFKTIHRRKDGTEAPMEVFAQFFSNGRKKLVCSLVRDLSDSVMYRELLEQTEAATNVGGWEWNIEEQDLVASAEALRIFDTDEHANLLPAQLSRQILGDHLAIWQNAVRKLLKGEEYDMVFQIQSFKQKEKWIHATAKPYLNSTGKVIKVLGTYQDISTQKSLEISLKIAFNEIEELKLKLEEENAYLQEEISTQLNFQGIITDSDNYKMVLEYIEKVAPTDTTVLITGESGTGKELLARAVHGLSRRKDSPLIKVNCAALPKDLIESELFGHKKGAFTGAISDKKGKFELADGGTLFLDEIGELPIQLQPKLLRVLQEGEFDVLGGTTTKQVDVRIIAATNRDLDLMTKDGTFREDLFYRLNVFPIYNPPLRERKEDIPT